MFMISAGSDPDFYRVMYQMDNISFIFIFNHHDNLYIMCLKTYAYSAKTNPLWDSE